VFYIRDLFKIKLNLSIAKKCSQNLFLSLDQTFNPNEISIFPGVSSISEAKESGDAFKVKTIKRFSSNIEYGNRQFIDIAILEVRIEFHICFKIYIFKIIVK